MTEKIESKATQNRQLFRSMQSGQLLRALKENAGLTQINLVEAIEEHLAFPRADLQTQISNWERDQQLPGADIVEAACHVLKKRFEKKDVLKELVDELQTAAELERKRNILRVTLPQVSLMSFVEDTIYDLTNVSLAPVRQMQKIENLLGVPHLLTDEQQVTFVCRYLDLLTGATTGLAQRMARGETLQSKQEFESFYLSPNVPQLRVFGKAHRVSQQTALAHLLSVPIGQVDFKSVSQDAQGRVYSYLKDKFINGTWIEKASVGHHLGRLPFFIPDEKEQKSITNEFKDLIFYGSGDENLWPAHTCSQALANFRRDDAIGFLRKEWNDIDEVVRIRTKCFEEAKSSNVFDDCMGFLQLLLASSNPIMNCEHIVINGIGEFANVAHKIARESGKRLPFDKLKETVNLIWDRRDWQITRAISLDLIRASLPYSENVGKAKKLLQEKSEALPDNLRNLSSLV